MECITCSKKLNEMTFVCDNCGTRQLENRVEVTKDNIDALIQPNDFNNRYTDAFEEEARKAYFLSSINKHIHGENRENMMKYFDYFFLRLMYEEDRILFLDDEYPIEDAKTVLTSLTRRKITKKTKAVLSNRFTQTYRSLKIPSFAIEKVPYIYITKHRNKKKILKGRDTSQIIVSVISSFIVTYVVSSFVVGVILGITLIRQGIVNPNQTAIQRYLNENPIYLFIPVVIAVVYAVFKGATDKKVDILDSLFKNKRLKKQVRKEIRPLLKKVRRRKAK
jgi:hypothetical protein